MEYNEPAPLPAVAAARLDALIEGAQVLVLLAREQASGTAVGVAVMRVQPSLWSNTKEADHAEPYVTPSQRGPGHGPELITKAIRAARQRSVTYAFLIPSKADQRAHRLYAAAGLPRTEGQAGPLMLAYERDL